MNTDSDLWQGTAAPPSEPISTEEHLTDLGNAMRLRRIHGKDLRYVCAEDAWYIWSPSGVWRRDDDGEVTRRAIRSIRDGHREALEEPDKDIRTAKVKHFLKSEAEPAILRSIRLARSLRDIAARPADFNADPYTLNTPSGTVDLRGGTLRPHDRLALCTRQTSAPFDPAATCPRWERFLEEVFPGDGQTVEFVRLALGYALTGDTREHAAFFPFGLGANGKSVLLETIRFVLGSYAATAEASTFLAKRDEDGGVRNDLARLTGVRFVTAIESEEGARLAEGFLKSITGGDTVTARFLFKEFFEFRPQFKVWLATNHKPMVRGTDDGIWRRIRLIPFQQRFEGEKQDRDLTHTLRAEAPGILAWLVRACLDWQERGLGTPPAVAAATKEYREDQDLIGRFLAERCDVGPHEFDTAKRIYENFRRWCEEQGEKAWSQKAVGMRLQERGFVAERTARERTWRGVAVSVVAE